MQEPVGLLDSEGSQDGGSESLFHVLFFCSSVVFIDAFLYLSTQNLHVEASGPCGNTHLEIWREMHAIDRLAEMNSLQIETYSLWLSTCEFYRATVIFP